MSSHNVLVSDKQCPVHCRDDQYYLLKSLFGQNEQHTVGSVFLYGTTGTGKSLVVNKLMHTLQVPHVKLDCTEFYSSRVLYEQVLNNISMQNSDQDSSNEAQSMPMRCDNMNDFVKLLKSTIDHLDLTNETLYIILDKAERLRDLDSNVLPATLRLKELTKCNVCVVLISEIVWEKFQGGTGLLDPFIIHFPDYNKDQLLEIMTLDTPEGHTREFYSAYCNLVINIFMVVCRNLNELRHMALLNFPKYVQPIESGECTHKDSRKLWRNIEPHLKKALQTVYLREVSSTQWEVMQMHTGGAVVPATPSHTARQSLELPFYSKYLLIAAYLASYNPAKSDKRFFAKHSGKQSKRKIVKHERTSNQLLGPKPFPLDRLMAIFYSIVEGKVSATSNIFSQVTSLVSLQLLGQIGKDVLEAPKYKCLVSLDFIKQIARSVQFDVVKYLYDFI